MENLTPTGTGKHTVFIFGSEKVKRIIYEDAKGNRFVKYNGEYLKLTNRGGIWQAF